MRYAHGKFFFERTVVSSINHDMVSDFMVNNDYTYVASYNDLNDDRLFKKEIKKTPIIEINDTADVIKSRFSSNTRNEINKTLRDSNFEFYGPVSGDDSIYNLHCDFERSQGRTPWLKEEVLNCHNFVACYRHIPIAFIAFVVNDGIMRVVHINSLRTSEKKLPLDLKMVSWATRRIMYEAVLYATKHSISTIDLGVANFTDQSKSGVTRFKMCFADIVVDTYIYRIAKTGALDEITLLRRDKNLYIH